jgi:hypothetical protein
MADIEKTITVVAAAAGTVLRTRDDVEDRLVRTEADRARVANAECGNGVVIEHDGGWETQYCHIKRGSVSVEPGDRVEQGSPIGAIGASGMAQFPHVHLEIRRNGSPVDPYTGLDVGAGCRFDGNRVGSLWSTGAIKQVDIEPTQIMAGGLAAGPVDHDALAAARPAAPNETSAALVGWVLFANLEAGDHIRLEIIDPAGRFFAGNDTDPFERSKATYSMYSGRRGAPRPGEYEVRGRVYRDGSLLTERVFKARVGQQ